MKVWESLTDEQYKAIVETLFNVLPECARIIHTSDVKLTSKGFTYAGLPRAVRHFLAELNKIEGKECKQ